MGSFLTERWFQDFSSFVEKDDDFIAHGRWFTGTIGFRCDQTTVSVRFDRGFVLSVKSGYDDPEYLISGTTDQWSYLFEKKWGLVRLYRSQTLTVRADGVKLMQNWKTIFFIVESMKRFAQRV
jgi:hypothetical protein